MHKIIFLFTLFFLFGCQPLCEDKIIKSVSSREGVDAIQYVRDCGATTDFATHIKLASGRHEEEVFVVDGYHKDDILLNWLDENHLEIKHNIDPENIFVSKASFQNIKIDYLNQS